MKTTIALFFAVTLSGLAAGFDAPISPLYRTNRSAQALADVIGLEFPRLGVLTNGATDAVISGRVVGSDGTFGQARIVQQIGNYTNPAAPTIANGVSTFNPDSWTTAGVGAGRTFANVSTARRLKRGGYVYAASVSVHVIGQGYKFKVLRPNGSNYDLISETAFYPTTLSYGSNYVTFPRIRCREGDIAAIFCAGRTGPGVDVQTNSTGAAKYGEGDLSGVNQPLPSSLSYDMCLQFYVDNPVIAYTGDSIIAGHNGGASWYPFLDSGSPISGTISNSIPFVASQDFASGVSYCNYGKGSQTFAWVDSTAMGYITNDGARVVWVHCGVNDVATGRNWADVLANLNGIRSKVASTNVLIISEILPWTAGSDTNALTVRTWNTNLALWCATNSATLARMHDGMGQLRDSTGFFDDLNPAYDQDGVHLTQAGVNHYVELMAQYLSPVIGIVGNGDLIAGGTVSATSFVLNNGNYVLTNNASSMTATGLFVGTFVGVVTNASIHGTNATITGTATAATTKASSTNCFVLKCPDGGSWILRIGNDGSLTTATNSSNL